MRLSLNGSMAASDRAMTPAPPEGAAGAFGSNPGSLDGTPLAPVQGRRFAAAGARALFGGEGPT